MSVHFSKALLMSGADYPLTDHITLHHPSIGEILDINQSPCPDSVYWSYVQILLADPYSNMVMLDDLGKNYLETSPYEVFLLHWNKCKTDYRNNPAIYDAYGIHPTQIIQKALRFFICGEHTFEAGAYADKSICLYDADNPACQINEEIFQYLCEWVKAVNKIDDSRRIKPADENARRILIEDMRDEIKKAKRRQTKNADNSDYFGNILSAVCFCGNGTINPFRLKDCKIYWINEALSISNKKSGADHLLDGIYHGAISAKDVNKKELDWLQ